jgi:hypothetical protein
MARRRFEGAITTPDEGEVDSSLEPLPERPPRPVSIEFASAILIVGGITSAISSLLYAASGADTGIIGAVIVALDVLTVVVGILIRRGRAWILAINVVAVALFLEITALPAGFAIMFTILDGLVLLALFRNRAWFDWRPGAVEREDDDLSLEASR